MNGTTSVPFPNMLSGDDGSAGSMEKNGLTPATNCQDNKDTAGYWVPEPFMVPPSWSPVRVPARRWLPDHTARPRTTCTCGSTTFRTGQPGQPGDPRREHHDRRVPGGLRQRRRDRPRRVHGGRPSYPIDLNIVEYTCGASSGSPSSRHRTRPGRTTAPTTPMRTTPSPKVWWASSNSRTAGTARRASRPRTARSQPGSPRHGSRLRGAVDPVHGLADLPRADARPSQRLLLRHRRKLRQWHTGGPAPGAAAHAGLGQGWGEPSTCTGDGGIGWNTTANAENSPSGGSTPNDNDEKVNGKLMTTTRPSRWERRTGVAIWGFHKCVAAKAPSPNGTVSTLSFACSHGADPNCTDNIGIPGTTTGCFTRQTATWVHTPTGGRPCTPTTGRPGKRPSIRSTA